MVFDLGGLLIEFRGVEAMAAWLGCAPSQELADRWLKSPAVRAFERGACEADEFARSLVADFGLALGPDEVLTEIAGWISGPVPGALELLDELRSLDDGGLRLACLSNTHAVHWTLLEDVFGARFDHLFLSHQTGHVKPDPEAFDQIPETLGLEPERVLFFDDQPLNVEAARARGLGAERALGPDDCRRELVARRVLEVRVAAGKGSDDR